MAKDDGLAAWRETFRSASNGASDGSLAPAKLRCFPPTDMVQLVTDHLIRAPGGGSEGDAFCPLADTGRRWTSELRGSAEVRCFQKSSNMFDIEWTARMPNDLAAYWVVTKTKCHT